MPLEFVQAAGAFKKEAINEEAEKGDVAQSGHVIEDIFYEEPPAHIDPEVAHATAQLASASSSSLDLPSGSTSVSLPSHAETLASSSSSSSLSMSACASASEAPLAKKAPLFV